MAVAPVVAMVAAMVVAELADRAGAEVVVWMAWVAVAATAQATVVGVVEGPVDTAVATGAMAEVLTEVSKETALMAAAHGADELAALPALSATEMMRSPFWQT